MEYVQRNKNTDLVNFLMNGKNSGIDIYNIEESRMSVIFKASDIQDIGVHMQRTLSEPNCTMCANKQFEAFKRNVKPTGIPELQFVMDGLAQGWNDLLGNQPHIFLFPPFLPPVTVSPVDVKPADFVTAIRLLNSQGGLRGMSAKLDAIIADQKTNKTSSCSTAPAAATAAVPTGAEDIDPTVTEN
jgi:hypothetical protein